MPKTLASLKTQYAPLDLAATAEFILQVQKRDGEIPWSDGGKTDPWDHVESAMGLIVGGHSEAARQAYQWSARTQLDDGSWWSCSRNGKPENGAYKDSNMTAYIAVGVLHYYLATGDDAFLRFMWPTVRKAIDYVLDLQAKDGEILWARRTDNSIDTRALLTGSSSIHMSLSCALSMARLVGEQKPRWEAARIKLRDAIRHKPHLFDESKSCFSMDWYYPILGGAMIEYQAQRRIEKAWDAFVVPDWGVRCVSDQPWATMAETAELTITLAAIGEFKTAELVFGWLIDKRYDDGAFWTGVTFPDGTIYTTEKTTWTAAAVLLAADILYDLSPASRLFSHSF
ncbi:MAG: phenyltransferase domain-containing protein [Desulfobacterales bacterium]|nr:phenyltransferase domain-containing protein [Desulfobacterales bacterium]